MCEQAILLGVPKAEYGPNGITPFPMCLKACASYRGQDIGMHTSWQPAARRFGFMAYNILEWQQCRHAVPDEDFSIGLQLSIEALGREHNPISRASGLSG